MKRLWHLCHCEQCRFLICKIPYWIPQALCCINTMTSVAVKFVTKVDLLEMRAGRCCSKNRPLIMVMVSGPQHCSLFSRSLYRQRSWSLKHPASMSWNTPPVFLANKDIQSHIGRVWRWGRLLPSVPTALGWLVPCAWWGSCKGWWWW